MKNLIKFLRKFFFLINVFVALYSLFVFQISLSADIKHWLGGFLMLSIPLVFAVNICFVFVYLFSKSWKFLLSLVILVIAYPLLQRTFNFRQKEINSADRSFSVLSYNVMYLDYDAYSSGRDRISAVNLANSIDSLSADINCFQEMYNSTKSEKLNVLKKLSTKYKHSVLMLPPPAGNEKFSGSIGLSIVSKYPIIDSEKVIWKPNNNGVLRADIVVNSDTIRVLNVQLKSMGIRVKKVLDATEDERVEETKNLLVLLKNGFQARSIQVHKIEEMIKESPYPVLVCGDFNELPYGYAYGRIRKLLANSFESSGKGFGFTYNKILGFLRIDNQFYDGERLNNMSFETFNDVPWSDHFPIKGVYEIK